MSTPQAATTPPEDLFPFDGQTLTEAQLLEVDEPRLRAEQGRIMSEQASGLWNQWEQQGQPEKVEARVRTGIAIAAILRRQNTGPAKAPGRKRTKVELEAIEDMLLK